MSFEKVPQVLVIVGEQRGDEAKGRFTDMLTPEFDIVGRGQGSHNAGHTVLLEDGRMLILHSIPSGIGYPEKVNIIGRGCFIHPNMLNDEIDSVVKQDIEVSPRNLKINSGTHLTLPHHVLLDVLREGDPAKMTGSTKSGVSFVAGAKGGRRVEESLRAEEIKNDPKRIFEVVRQNLQKHKRAADRARDKGAEISEEVFDPIAGAERYVEAALKLAAFITDTEIYLDDRLDEGARLLCEGAQGFWLDPDHGMWPDVTSTSTTAGGVLNGLGIPPVLDGGIKVLGVTKLVQTSVGGGPFATRIDNQALIDELRKEVGAPDSERGKTTGRDRDIGYLDLPAIRRAQRRNGTSEMAVAKLDDVHIYARHDGAIKVATSYTRTKMDEDGVVTQKLYHKAPDAAYKLHQCTPNYVELPAWDEDVSAVRKFKDLPKEAQNYIGFMEKNLGKVISLVGVGPARDQVIDRRPELGIAH
jgi:adenylosuccinate synthase